MSADLICLCLQGLPDSIAVNAASWKKIYDSLEPDHAPLPEPWRSELNALQKIVTLRMLRPDKVTPALSSFVAEALGRRFVEPKPFAIEPSYNDSSCNTPLIFVLSPGRWVTPAPLPFPAWLLNKLHAPAAMMHFISCTALPSCYMSTALPTIIKPTSPYVLACFCIYAAIPSEDSLQRKCSKRRWGSWSKGYKF